MDVSAHTDSLRNQLIAVALDWERRFGVAPLIISALSEYDAACLVGHTDESYGRSRFGRSTLTYGSDFTFGGLRYHIKANRLGSQSGSSVVRVIEARNYHWDKLVWLLYDHQFNIREAWEWQVEEYRAEFEGRETLSPDDMREGKRLK